MCDTIRFGIASIDELLDPSNAPPRGVRVNNDKDNDNETLTVSLIGSDGTAKSALAMHLAATYFSSALPIRGASSNPPESSAELPIVIYVATNLRPMRIKQMWKSFGLQHERRPGVSELWPFAHDENASLARAGDLDVFSPYDSTLASTVPSTKGLTSLVGVSDKVKLVDLASHATGDDWAYVNRLIAALHMPAGKGSPMHMVIIDSIGGLEAISNDKDSFGESRSRLSRLAQLKRSASEKCHLVLLEENKKSDSAGSADSAADVVVRLRFRRQRGYSRRTIEIVSVRGQSHVRGEHDFSIRGGGGSQTGSRENEDDRQVFQLGGSDDTTGETKGEHRSYFNVCQSLHYLSRKLEYPSTGTSGGDHNVVPREMPRCGFGITYLDNLLGHPLHNDQSATSEPPVCDSHGLPADAPAAIIGEDGTHKSCLARAFLSQNFRDPSSADRLSLLITTNNLEQKELANRFGMHLQRSLETSEVDRILCRRLDLSHLSSAAFVQIVQAMVRAAQSKCFPNKRWLVDPAERRKLGWKIRLVIENWTIIEKTYPEVRRDPLCLPFLLNFLRQEGISTLLVATSAIGKNRKGPSVATTLEELVPHHIYTWQVPFYGSNHVAIAVDPPIVSSGQAVVRELRLLSPEQQSKGAGNKDAESPVASRGPTGREPLIVDPRFEVYEGWDEGKPRLGTLKVRLFAETPLVDDYIQDLNRLASRLIFGEEDREVVIAEPPEGYERLREFSYLQRGVHLDYTLVFQADEFWSESHPGLLLKQERYLLDARTTGKEHQPAEDPYALFQPTIANWNARQIDKEKKAEKAWRRVEFFTPIGHKYDQYKPNKWTINKVPFLWDFGFLMLRERAWRKSQTAVGDVYNSLTSLSSNDCVAPVSWERFFEACLVVAGTHAKSEPGGVFPFDVSLIAPESFSCLVLEIWASEILKRHKEVNVFPTLRHDEIGMSLTGLVEKYSDELYAAWLLLSEVISHGQFPDGETSFRSRPAHASAIAARHWYSTACAAAKASSTDDRLVPARLPGSYTTRGDWFLAMGRINPSARLGEHAMDLLCSRRGNIVRLQKGLGLPVRDLAGPGAEPNGELWTPIPKHRNPPEISGPVMYHEIRSLGARDEADKLGNSDLHWLWRSQIARYDIHARIWQRWLCHILQTWAPAITPGAAFDAYKRLGDNHDIRLSIRYSDFDRECELLQSTLKRASIVDEDGIERSGK